MAAYMSYNELDLRLFSLIFMPAFDYICIKNLLIYLHKSCYLYKYCCLI